MKDDWIDDATYAKALVSLKPREKCGIFVPRLLPLAAIPLAKAFFVEKY